MRLIIQLLVVCAATVFIPECFSLQGDNPGIRLRVTNRGLQYAKDMGVAKLMQKLRSDRLDDIRVKERKQEYALYNIKNKGVSIASSSLRTAPGVGLVLQANGIDLELSGDWWLKKKIGWINTKHSGSVTVRGRGIGFSLTARIGVDSGGRPTISTQDGDCTSHVNDVDIRFSSWFLNIFKGFIERKLKEKLKKLICLEGKKLINEEAAKTLATFPVKKRISYYAEIDYSLLRSPYFASSYMDLPLKGEFKSPRNPQVAPFSPEALPNLGESDKMMYIWLTDYVFNTASLVYHDQGVFRITIRPDKNSDSNFKLNTKSFQGFLPELFKRYPFRPIFVKLYTTQAPTFASDRAGINVTLVSNLEVYVTGKNGTSIYALTLGLNVTLAGSLGVRNGNLTLHADSFGVRIRDVRSAIGNIRPKMLFLQVFLDGFVQQREFMDQINRYGERGFPLPMLHHTALENTQVTSGKGFTLVKTNLKYSART